MYCTIVQLPRKSKVSRNAEQWTVTKLTRSWTFDNNWVSQSFENQEFFLRGGHVSFNINEFPIIGKASSRFFVEESAYFGFLTFVQALTQPLLSQKFHRYQFEFGKIEATREKLTEKENKARKDLRCNRDTTCESGVDPERCCGCQRALSECCFCCCCCIVRWSTQLEMTAMILLLTYFLLSAISYDSTLCGTCKSVYLTINQRSR